MQRSTVLASSKGALLLALILATLTATPVGAAVVDATLVAQEGDVPPGGDGDPVSSLNAPFSTGSGAVGFTGALDTGGATDHFVWVDTGVVWRNSDEVGFDLTGAEGTMGISNAGGFIYSPSVSGDDGVWTHNGLLAVEGEAAPGYPDPATTTFHSRPTMVSNGTAYWIAGIALDGGGGTDGRALYSDSDAAPGGASVVLSFGDVIDGLPIQDGSGVDFDYQLSDNGHHIHVLLLETGDVLDDGHVYVDGATVAQENLPTGTATDNWDNFDNVSINDSGDYLFSGDTDGDSGSDEFIAYNGSIVVREGDTLDGVSLATSASLQALSINNLGHAAFTWNYSDGETLFFACQASDIPGTAVAVLSLGDEVDFDGDGSGEATVTDLNASGVVGPGLSLAEDGRLHVEVDLDYGDGDLEAILALDLPSCGDDGIELTIGGECPGTIEVDVSGATPSSALAILSGAALGADPIPAGPCFGTPTGLSSISLLSLVTSDVDGGFELVRSVPGNACGRLIQVLDLTSCETSGVVAVP